MFARRVSGWLGIMCRTDANINMAIASAPDPLTKWVNLVARLGQKVNMLVAISLAIANAWQRTSDVFHFGCNQFLASSDMSNIFRFRIALHIFGKIKVHAFMEYSKCLSAKCVLYFQSNRCLLAFGLLHINVANNNAWNNRHFNHEQLSI